MMDPGSDLGDGPSPNTNYLDRNKGSGMVCWIPPSLLITLKLNAGINSKDLNVR